jgi:hypothetical protein
MAPPGRDAKQTVARVRHTYDRDCLNALSMCPHVDAVPRAMYIRLSLRGIK